MSETRISRALTIVGWLFLLQGIAAVIDVVGWAMQGRLNVNMGLLGLAIGPGLFRLDPKWRRWALIFTRVTMVAAALAVGFLLIVPSPFDVQLFGRTVAKSPRVVAFSFIAVMLLVTVWQYRVLMRSDVRAEFREPA